MRGRTAIKIDINRPTSRPGAQTRARLTVVIAFADSAFAAHHDQLVLDPGHAGLHLPHLVGIC
jgi:hypothetical protein